MPEQMFENPEIGVSPEASLESTAHEAEHQPVAEAPEAAERVSVSHHTEPAPSRADAVSETVQQAVVLPFTDALEQVRGETQAGLQAFAESLREQRKG